MCRYRRPDRHRRRARGFGSADGSATSLRRFGKIFYGPVRLIREILQPNDHFLLFGGELGEFQLVNQQVDGIQDPVELIAVTANLA